MRLQAGLPNARILIPQSPFWNVNQVIVPLLAIKVVQDIDRGNTMADDSYLRGYY
jgi:hypothetical protein